MEADPWHADGSRDRIGVIRLMHVPHKAHVCRFHGPWGYAAQRGKSREGGVRPTLRPRKLEKEIMLFLQTRKILGGALSNLFLRQIFFMGG